MILLCRKKLVVFGKRVIRKNEVKKLAELSFSMDINSIIPKGLNDENLAPIFFGNNVEKVKKILNNKGE